MSAISDFTSKEIISDTVQKKQPAALIIKVPLQLTERRIFVYTEILQSAAAAFRFRARIIPFTNGRPVGNGFPADLGDLSASAGDSFASLFNGGGSPVGDSLVLRFVSPFVATNVSVTLQPMRLNAAIDEIRLDIDEMTGANITNWRAYLACLSTKY